MMDITPGNTRLWSRLGSRGMFGQAILALASEDPKLMVLSADLGNSSGLERFRNSYPEQFLNIGIAEQNMIGIASGLAKEGFTVFATSFAPFISMRAAEQIRMNLGYMKLNVKAVAIGSGLSMGLLGNSHYGIEDAAIMRAIPNLTVVCPADCSEIAKTVFAAAKHHGPMYIRLTGGVNTPVVYQSDYDFEIGKAITLQAGNDIALIATGSMVHAALETAKRLEAGGVSCSVINMHTIKPLDTDTLAPLVAQTKLMVTLEEHSRIGGLGSAVAEYLAGLDHHPPLEMIGLADSYDKAGEYAYLLDMHGLRPDKLTETVLARYQRISRP